MTYDPAFQLRIYEMLMASQYWPPAELHAYQNQQMFQLLRFAHSKVPFYRAPLARVLNDDGSINQDRWADVPILTRDHLVNNREDMLAPELPPGHGYVDDHLGSGSTGKPVVSRHNALMPVVSNTALFRAFAWHGFDYSQNFCAIEGNDPRAGSWPEGSRGDPWAPHWETAAGGHFYNVNRNVSNENIVEFLIRKNIKYLSGRPSKLHAVALAAEREGRHTPLQAMVALGETISDTTREDCRRAMGVEIMGLYASKEVYNIAHQCNLCGGYHVNAEMLLFEVLKDNGEPAKPGELGRAIITSFFNTAQPFIRYDQGDLIVLGDPKKCARRLPVIETILGRTNHLFRFPGGRKVGTTLPAKHMGILAARSWQLAQVEDLAIEVRYIPDGSGRAPDFDFIRDLVIARTDPRVAVKFKEISELPLTSSGKFIEVICELPPA